jgi:hypothetical protein
MSLVLLPNKGPSLAGFQLAHVKVTLAAEKGAFLHTSLAAELTRDIVLTQRFITVGTARVLDIIQVVVGVRHV